MSGVPERMAAALDVAAEQVRAANHLTHGGAFVLTWHYSTLGAVVEVTGRLPQLIEHMQICARRAATEPQNYRADDDEAPATRLAEISEDLRHAGELLSRLDRVLNDAWAGLGTLAYLDPAHDPAHDPDADEPNGEHGDQGDQGDERAGDEQQPDGPRVPRRRRPRGGAS